MMDLIVVHDDDGAIHADWLIRCKDCKYWWYGNYCDKHSKGQSDADWFCADGVRKDDECSG